jgi:hypothetical protein
MVMSIRHDEPVKGWGILLPKNVKTDAVEDEQKVGEHPQKDYLKENEFSSGTYDIELF